jgi:putative addiction module killer protein
MNVVEYLCADDSSPFKSWFDELDALAAAKVAAAILRLELGNTSNVKWIGKGLGEFRIDWGPGYRLYLAQEGDALIILFTGGTKKRQQADIDRARMLLEEYKARKAAETRRKR